MNVLSYFKTVKKGIAVLIDPDKFNDHKSLSLFLDKIQLAQPHMVFIGGSSVSKVDFTRCVELANQKLDMPVVLFPGASHHISKQADALLFLSLVSGRNPDFLIGHHVEAIEDLEQINLEVIPTSYLLINGGKMTSVEYVSRTVPIPQEEVSIARKTAMAGKYLGHQLIYADAGSGAINPINGKMISALASVGSPLIIGGGIRSIEAIEQAHQHGANIVVIGNKLEENIDFLLDLKNYLKPSL